MDTPKLIFIVVLGATVAFFLFNFVKFGGFKAAMFGARIERTVGEAQGSDGHIMKTLVRVHVLDGGPDKAVGLEFVARSFTSYQMTPITLSSSQARDLIRQLQSAVGES